MAQASLSLEHQNVVEKVLISRRIVFANHHKPGFERAGLFLRNGAVLE